MAVHDMSAIANTGFPSYGASEHGGNTVSDPPLFAAPGTPSEGTDGIDANDTPNLSVPAEADYAKFVHAGADAFASHGWSTPAVDSDGWTGTRP